MDSQLQKWPYINILNFEAKFSILLFSNKYLNILFFFEWSLLPIFLIIMG